jgi:hypothetical protein
VACFFVGFLLPAVSNVPFLKQAIESVLSGPKLSYLVWALLISSGLLMAAGWLLTPNAARGRK